MLDLWAGMSGLCVALLGLGVTFYALAAEQDEQARQVASQNMPSIVHVARVEDISLECLLPFLQRRKVRGILLGGGAPCQPHSSLNTHRQGMADTRASQPSHVRRLLDELHASPACADLEIFTLLENVASMQPEAAAQLSKWAGGQPFRSDAQFCGWTKRNRLYWLCSRTQSLSPSSTEAPNDWQWFSHQSGPPELRYVGSKPLPKSVHWLQGYTPITTPQEVMKGHALPFFTFTREFWHPLDSATSESPEFLERFHQDNRRFPVKAYRESSLLWKRESWRQPLPEERAQMLGVPTSLLEAAESDGDRRKQAQNSRLGNGFHIFTVMVILAMLPQLCQSKLQVSSLQPDQDLRDRISGTPWDPCKRAAFPGLLDAPALVQDIQEQLGDFLVDRSVWQETTRLLSFCDLALLQLHVMFARGRGYDWYELGPTSLDRRSRAKVFTSITGQRYPSDSSKGLDFLLPPGLGKELHIEHSAQLPSPFEPCAWPEKDIDVPLQALSVWREHLPCLAQRQRDVLRTVRKALQPLDDALWPFRVESSRRVAAKKSPAFVACMVSVLRWPDRAIAAALVKGFEIVGDIASSHLFRSVAPKEAPALEDWLRTEAAEAVENIIHSPPPKMHQEILQVTLEEIDKGFCSPLKSKAELDAIFGQGKWRPLERFVLNQQGKLRVIDNARKTNHNAHACLHETIWTTNVDFVPAVIRQALSLLELPQDVPDWLRFRVGTEDLPDAYRGLPVCPEHLAVSIAAVFVPQVGWRFTILWGLAYGLEAAVVAFNRFPCLCIAVSRRCCSALSSSYFDDMLALEAVATSDISRQGVLAASMCMGAPPQPAKSFPPAPDRIFLGVSIHVGDAAYDRMLFMQCKESTKRKVCSKLDAILESGTLSRDEASKLRGDIQWMFSACAGNAARYASPLLRQAQCEGIACLTEEDRVVLTCLRHMVRTARPRVMDAVAQAPPCMTIYTDASFEKGELRLGWVLFFPPPQQTLAGTCLVPEAVLSDWKPRVQQIFPGETLAVLVIPLLYPNLIRNMDALWFIDNQAAVSAAITGSSKEGDIHEIAHYAAVLRANLSFRVFFEWVDSDSNPSDGLSRLGLECPWTQKQPWQIEEFAFPDAGFRGNLQALLTSASETVGDLPF